MLTRNIQINQFLCKRSLNIVKGIIYVEGQCPPALPLGVAIELKDYTGPNFFKLYEKSVSIVTLISQAYVDNEDMERIQLLLKLC